MFIAWRCIFDVQSHRTRIKSNFFVTFLISIEQESSICAKEVSILNNWFIHSIFSVAQLKRCSSFLIDFFKRFKSNHSDFVFVNDDTVNVKFFELFRIINKRMIKKRDIEYLVEWKDYESKHNVCKTRTRNSII